MSRKRSLKHRCLQLLRRIWPAPTLAAFALSLGACASRPVASASSSATTVSNMTAAPQTPSTPHDGGYDWDPRLLPTRLQLAPEFRSGCAPAVVLPPSLVLEEKDEVVGALEPIAACLTVGPLAHERLHLLGSSELPGRWDAPVQGSGRADHLRSSLSLLGVPFEDLITYDVDNGKDVELGIAQGSS
jgi:hypothetical protein